MHPIKDRKDRIKWIKTQIAAGKTKTQLFDELSPSYKKQSELAREIGQFIEPNALSLFKSKFYTLAALLSFLAISMLVSQALLKVPINGGAFLDNIFFPAAFIIAAFMLLNFTSSSIVLAKLLSILELLYSIILFGSSFLISQSKIAPALAGGTALLCAILSMHISFQLKNNLYLIMA
ncbi:hypothetical protein EHQ05_13720 [Leptospira yasudae]|uniref:hypothetical protein n=1 Tax=Leptospira yasudae TaxID=2202201 RepID=UPI0010845F16|nr:hypothetical protein [Leptospira yasudae]TGK25923.1 hypothetical protein EHQ05_13720 [Leptospira yasudae]TGM03022.1 hypothetical protein EHQ86_18435 [Leptospira yasudae]